MSRISEPYRKNNKKQLTIKLRYSIIIRNLIKIKSL